MFDLLEGAGEEGEGVGRKSAEEGIERGVDELFDLGKGSVLRTCAGRP